MDIRLHRNAFGRLVFTDALLPGEAGAVRRRVPLLDRFPSRPQLTALERDAARGKAPLVLVDDVDRADPDEVAARRGLPADEFYADSFTSEADKHSAAAT